MRPRVFPAEDPTAARRPLRSHQASMRPRVFPAEDSPARFSIQPAHGRFNEAAGIPRGRRSPVCPAGSRPPGFNEAAGIPRGRHAGGRGEAARTGRASMRPRVFPAEDPGSTHRTSRTSWASMRPRVFPAEDNRGDSRWRSACSKGFNEAAGIPRGRPL